MTIDGFDIFFGVSSFHAWTQNQKLRLLQTWLNGARQCYVRLQFLIKKTPLSLKQMFLNLFQIIAISIVE
jgi:hypothetical protein